MDKQSLRQWAKDKRKGLNMEAISTILSEKLVQIKEYKNAKNIMIFYPLPNEVNLLALLNDKTKQFYLPRIKGKELECCPYNVNDKLVKSEFNTYEPVCEACDKKEVDLVIVPALICDKNGFRLGYGGGFYDRFLKNYEGKTICCIPSELIVESIQKEEYDIKIGLVISDK